VAIGILVVGVLVAAGAPLLATHDPRASVGQPSRPPSLVHPFGTNDLGQDVWSQFAWGARASMLVAAQVSVLSLSLSWAVGLLAGFFRWAEAPLMTATDLLLSLPAIPLYMLVVTLVGPSQTTIAVTLGLLSWPTFAKIVRGRVIDLRRQPFVTGARAVGATEQRILARHIIPGTYSLMSAKLVITLRFALFAEATLAFLGLGDPVVQSWGTMLRWAFASQSLFLTVAWTWWVIPPAVGIAGVVFAAAWLAQSYDEPWNRPAISGRVP
jgi:ABC-type dipeptide/oligopeptide/nickel transport system permease subunit